MARPYYIHSKRLNLLSAVRRSLLWLFVGQVIVGAAWMPTTHEVPWGSIVLGPTFGVLCLVLHLLVRKEEKQLAAKHTQRMTEEIRLHEQMERINTLLTGVHASGTPRYRALLNQGAIAPSFSNMDPFGVAVQLWTTITPEDWAILDFYFKKTEEVAVHLATQPTNEEDEQKAMAFFEQEAAAAFQALSARRQQQSGKLDDLIWQSRQTVNIDPI